MQHAGNYDGRRQHHKVPELRKTNGSNGDKNRRVNEMTEKSDSPRQRQAAHRCDHCDFTSIKHGPLVLHCKEAHDVEL